MGVWSRPELRGHAGRSGPPRWLATNPLPGGGTWQTFHTAWIYADTPPAKRVFPHGVGVWQRGQGPAVQGGDRRLSRTWWCPGRWVLNAPPVGVVALQGVEVGEDFAVQGRGDGDQGADHASARMLDGVGDSAADQGQTLRDRWPLVRGASFEQPPVVALSGAERPVDEHRVLATPSPRFQESYYRITGNTAKSES